MKKLLFVLLVLLFLPSALSAASDAAATVEIPPAVRRLLNKNYPGWRFPKADFGIRQYFKKSDAELNTVKGDFDGNGQMDVALQIERGTGEKKTLHLLAFFKKGGNYQLHIVDKQGSGDFIALSPKGSKGYNWETEKNFVFARDAIETVYFEKAAVAYVFEKGKFRAIVTSD